MQQAVASWIPPFGWPNLILDCACAIYHYCVSDGYAPPKLLCRVNFLQNHGEKAAQTIPVTGIARRSPIQRASTASTARRRDAPLARQAASVRRGSRPPRRVPAGSNDAFCARQAKNREQAVATSLALRRPPITSGPLPAPRPEVFVTASSGSSYGFGA